MSKKITTEDFIVRAKTTHGDKYGYEKVHYTKMHDKVCIVCPKHGEFWQRAYHHVYGGGCPKCAGKEQLTTEEFISIANKRHNNFYGYKSTKYVNSKSKVIITCPKHGNFEQIASDHLAGSGCPKCACIGKLTTEEFIERSKKIHNNKYDYSKVKYKNSRTKVCIVCPEHGEFLQEPASHLRGNGCPECAKEMCGKSRIVN